MDIRAYIESGILEQYVLGKLSSAEIAEVERYAQEYAVVSQEISAIEQALEKYVFSQAIAPPPGTLERILERVGSGAVQPITEKSFLSRLQPRSWTRFLAVGMTIKFLAAATGLVILYLHNQNLHERIEANQVKFNQAQVACTELERTIRFLKDVNTRPIVMNGTPESPTSIAAVYLNPKSESIYIGNLQLPPPPSDKQYQLWAIVDGKPASMGVFDIPISGEIFIEVPFIANAQAFAISLEKKGGNPTPTQVFVIGNV